MELPCQSILAEAKQSPGLLDKQRNGKARAGKKITVAASTSSEQMHLH